MKHLQTAALTILLLTLAAACSPTPVDIKFDKDEYILDGPEATGQIVATALDADGGEIKEGVDMTFFCANRKVVLVGNDGKISAVSSGEDTVEVEIVGADIKKTVKVRVKIASNIETTHEKLRLWTGQVKKNVAAWVVSEKKAYIEGYIPTWSSEDPSIVSVKDIKDPTGSEYPRSYVEMVGIKSGDTTITATYKNLTKSITVRVYDEDEEVDLSGRRKPKDAKKNAEDAKKTE
jgi:hypothetical protein